MYSQITYEEPDFGQTIANLAVANDELYIIGYLKNSGGRSLYRAPLSGSGRLNLFGHYPAINGERYGDGQVLWIRSEGRERGRQPGAY